MMMSAFEDVGLMMPKNVPLALPFEIAVGPRAKRASVAVACGVLLTKIEVAAAFCANSELPSAEPEVQSGSVFAMPALLVVTVPVPQVTLKVIVPVELPPFVTQPAPVKLVTPTFVSELPLKLKPVPIVVAPSRPLALVLNMEEVVFAMMVELLKVAVELNVAPPVKVCAADHVTLDAAVTNPGFTNDIAPVEVLNEIGLEPENSE